MSKLVTDFESDLATIEAQYTRAKAAILNAVSAHQSAQAAVAAAANTETSGASSLLQKLGTDAAVVAQAAALAKAEVSSLWAKAQAFFGAHWKWLLMGAVAGYLGHSSDFWEIVGKLLAKL